MHDTGERWSDLLGYLTDEELDQYGRMALDQARKERARLSLHILLVLAALGLIAWASWTIYHVGEAGWLVYLELIAAGICLYIPWLSIKSRERWLGHFARVNEERARRQESAADGETATDGA